MKNLVKTVVAATIAMTSTAFAGAIFPEERNPNGVVEFYHLKADDQRAIIYGHKDNDFVSWDSHVKRGSVTIKNYGAYSLTVSGVGGYRTVVTGQSITTYGTGLSVKVECAGWGDAQVNARPAKVHYIRAYNGNCFNVWTSEFDTSNNSWGGAELPTDRTGTFAPSRRAYTASQ